MSFLGGFSLYGGVLGGAPSIGVGLAIILGIIALIVGIYALYKLAVCVSGHETTYPEEYETVGHKEKKDSTAKWFVFGIIPILNLYFIWKMGEAISGHETVHS